MKINYIWLLLLVPFLLTWVYFLKLKKPLLEKITLSVGIIFLSSMYVSLITTKIHIVQVEAKEIRTSKGDTSYVFFSSEGKAYIIDSKSFGNALYQQKKDYELLEEGKCYKGETQVFGIPLRTWKLIEGVPCPKT